MRLRQSYSGYLLGRGGKTLRELQRDIEKGRTPTKAMEDGALVDQLLYGGTTYTEVGTCTKRSGPDKGKPFDPEDWTSADAQEQRAAARERGQVCCLKSEVDAALAQKQSLIDALQDDGIDLVNGVNRLQGDLLDTWNEKAGAYLPLAPGVYTQPRVHWTSEDGVQCAGTLDILEVFAAGHWRIIDTKLSMRADEEWLSKQAADMGWDVQCGAYKEACERGLNLDPALFRGYAIAVCEKRSKLWMSAVHWLEDIFIHCGDEQWRRCKLAWADAVKNDEWPGVTGGKLSPPGYYVSRVFDTADSAAADDLSGIGLDVSDLDTEAQ